MRSVNEVIKDINDYYGCNFATESFNKGRDTIYLDIPSVITTSLAEEHLNRLCGEENVIETLKELFPTLKFFNSKDILRKKEEFKSDVEYSSRLDDNNFDNTLIANSTNSENDYIKMANAIEVLNSLFKKRYVANSKRGVIMNVGGFHMYPFPEKIKNKILNIKSKEDARKVVDMLLEIPDYRGIEGYLLDKDNSNWKKVLESDSKKVVVEYEEYKKFTPLLEKVNKWLRYPLYFDSCGQIVYDVEISLSKKQRKKKKCKTKMETQVLPSRLTESFINISSDEDTMAFLVRLYNFHSLNFIRIPSKIFREKIYVEEQGFVDDYGLLDVLRAMNKRFDKPQVFVADELKLKDKYVIKDATILQMIGVQKREDISQEEKNELIFKKIESLNVIKPKEYKFYGGQEMLDLEDSILDKCEELVTEYYDMLNNLTLKVIKSAATYSDSIYMVINSEEVEVLKRRVKEEYIEPEVKRYKDIIEISSPLFNVTFSKKDLSDSGDIIFDRVITLNNTLCQSIKNIYMLSQGNALNILSYYKSFIKETIKNNSQDIIEALRNEGKYNDKDINVLEKELKDDVYFSKIKLNLETLYYYADEYKLDFLNDELLRQEFNNRIEKDIKENHEKLLKYRKSLWDRILEAKKEADSIQNIKEYATIVYLVGDERNKGITTYINILLGKKSEYSSNSVYGALKYLKANKIESMIEELIDLNVLDRASKRASFGSYTAIVKGSYYNENIFSKFKNGNFIGEDTILTNNKKNKESKGSIKKEVEDFSLKSNKNVYSESNSNAILSISAMEFIKRVKDIELTLINKNNFNVAALDIKDIQEFCSIIYKDRKFYNKNWELISNIIPPLSDQAIMFLKLKSINNNDSLRNIVEIEEKKREG